MALANVPAVLPDDNGDQSVPAQRAGITVDHAGTQSSFGFIDPQTFRDFGPDTSTGKLCALNLTLIDTVGQRIHNLHTDAVEARAKGKDPDMVLPSPRARQSLLESDEKTLDAFEAEVANASTAHLIDEINAVPFDTKGYGLPEVLRDQELRAAYARMTLQQRRDVAQRGNFMRAVLTAEPELSGLTPSEQKLMLQSELISRQPHVVAQLAADAQVLDALKQTAQAVKTALANERKQLGLSAAPTKPTRLAPRRWK
jgi:hypothetical protein